MMSDDAVIGDAGAAVAVDAAVAGGAVESAEAVAAEVPGGAAAADGSAVVDTGVVGDGGGADAGGGGFEIVWPEGAEVSEPLAEVALRAAREAGVSDGAQAGAFVVKALEGINARAAAVEAEAVAQLKADWGEDYAALRQECTGFLQRLRDESGLSEGDVAPLMSAKGFRLVRAMMGYVGERAAAGLTGGVPDAGERGWAREAMRNPQHGDYAALHDVANPRWREVNERYNRAMGMNGF